MNIQEIKEKYIGDENLAVLLQKDPAKFKKYATKEAISKRSERVTAKKKGSYAVFVKIEGRDSCSVLADNENVAKEEAVKIFEKKIKNAGIKANVEVVQVKSQGRM